MLHSRNAVTMMVGAIYSPRNVQIARKCARANIRPVE
jgi:hypothetical protein